MKYIFLIGYSLFLLLKLLLDSSFDIEKTLTALFLFALVYMGVKNLIQEAIENVIDKKFKLQDILDDNRPQIETMISNGVYRGLEGSRKQLKREKKRHEADF